MHQTSVAADSGAEKHSFWHQTPDSVDSGAENDPSVHQTELSGCELPVNGKNKIPQKSISFLIEKMFLCRRVSKKRLYKPRMWDVSHAFPTAVLTASGLKGIISAEWHPQAKC